MRLFIIGGTAVVTALLVQPAQAVSSKVSGKYAFQEIDLCESRLLTTPQNVLVPPAPSPGTQTVTKTVALAQPGLMSAGIGYITFTPTTTTGGSFSLTSTIVEGGALRLNNVGFTMNAHADTVTGTWSINSATDPTAVTITPTGGAAQTFTLRYANVSTTAPTTGIARTFYLVQRSTMDANTNCLTTINGTRQTP